MNETRDMIMDAAGRLFGDLCDRQLWTQAENGEWPQQAWEQLAEMGLPQALLGESAGGTGLSVGEILPVLELTGYYALPLPLAETMVANHLLHRAGIFGTDAPITLASPLGRASLQLKRTGNGWQVDGELRRIPCGRHAAYVVATAEVDGQAMLMRIPANRLEWQQDINLAGEPRDTTMVEGLPLEDNECAMVPAQEPTLLELGAVARALQMAGAMRRVLEMSVQYANERVQFGRPIGKFQAVQQQLAAMAGQVAASGAAADAAAERISQPQYAFAIAVAKARVGEAAGIAAAIGHQVHAAMGFTREHTLHYSTRRLWSWRDEFGSEPYWQEQLGILAAAQGRDGLWPYLTAAA